ncbi:hypothetical protein Q428_12210 [Fervidicella metallireducens AeB]|uniref:Lipid II flippase MurJ n=1 Tax=Fervidicella metallireducens AeB TaxID=1403537 RepID=A0A017RUS1_9CLOT|nr:hypothetical protein Q428_12210 [Fervidicella metallireducens AeB]
MNFAVQIPDFSKVGKRFRFKIDMKDEGFRQMMILMVPGIIGLSVSQINYVVNQNIASQLDTGSITALRYAYRVMLLPLGIFAMSLATTIFPKLNTHVSRNEMDEYKKTFSMGIRTVMFITIPSMVGLLVLSSPIIRLLFKTGKFTEADVKVTAFALAFYSFGLLGQSAVQIITRGFYSIKDTKTPLKIGVLTVAINITLNLIFVKSSSLAVGGIALSHSITTFINMYLLYRSLSKKVNGLRTRETVVSCAKSAVSAAAMGVVVYFVSGFMEARFGIESKTAQLLDVGSAIVIGGTVYFLVAYLLRMSEMQYVVDTLKKKFKK